MKKISTFSAKAIFLPLIFLFFALPLLIGPFAGFVLPVFIVAAIIAYLLLKK